MQGIDKQRADIDQIPVVVRSIQALADCELICEIVLVCPSAQIPDYYSIIKDYDLDLVSAVVGGGQTRQTSVFAGINACESSADYFLIHDGARPLVSTGEIRACIADAMRYGAAALGVRPRDTFKQVDGVGYISATIDRSNIIAIQTPQVFGAELYRQAMEATLHEGKDYTDDCQLIESMGRKVFVTPGSHENFKITTPHDLAIASAVLRLREEGIEQWLDAD